MTSEYEVTANQPNSPFHTTGTDHITIWGSNEDDTIEFYRDLLGMPLVLKQPNLDDPSQTHLFFDTGDGCILTVFTSDGRQSNTGGMRTPTGGVHHLCFSIDAEKFEEVKKALREAGHRYNVFDRGIFYSLYTTDHNGLVIELSVDRYDIPGDRKAEVYAEAQSIREDAGADYVEDHHLRQALENLGLDAEPADLPDAETGTGV